MSAVAFGWMPPRYRFAHVVAPFATLTTVESDRGLVAVDFTRLAVPALRRKLAGALGELELTQAPDLNSARQLSEYLTGQRRRFDLPLDWALVRSSFARAVLEAMCAVPWGAVVSYGELGRALGRPSAARAVGGACGQNPLPVVVPCHRVTAADGTIGGFSGGLGIKRALHALEGIVTRARR